MHEESAATFNAHFECELRDIRQVRKPLHRKILYASVLDPFSRACFGQSGTHRDRVSRLIQLLSDWNAHSRVSLPQLMLSLEENKEDSTGGLYSEARKALAHWPEGQVIRLQNSPEVTVLQSIAINHEQKNLLARSQYVALFYTYRNTLVHEFREPGYGFEFSNDGTEPYYHSMMNEPWQLVFPVAFFDFLISSILSNLGKYFTDNNIAPHDQFDFGSAWRSK